MLTLSRTVRGSLQSSILAEPRCPIAFPTPERRRERLTLRHAWRPWASFQLGFVFSSLGGCLRQKSQIAARIAGPVIILTALPGFASAQDATWSPSTPDFNTPTNWTPATVPTGTATFNNSGTTALTFSQDTTVGAMQFNAPNYTFELTNAVDTIAITGVGIVADPLNAPTFDVSFPDLEFRNSSTAGPAILNAFNTGPIAFLDNSNAGNATIHAGLVTSGSRH